MLQGRSLRRRGAWAALFALGLQIALSFGHVHRPDGTVAGPAEALAQIAGIATPHPALPDDPIKKSPDDAAHDVCAICVSIQFAGALIVPAPVSIAPRRFVSAVLTAGLVDFGLPALPHHPFQTRAPPAV